MNIAKQQFFKNLYSFGSGLFRTIYLNCRSSKHCKKLIFKKSVHFTALYLLVGNITELGSGFRSGIRPGINYRSGS
jgi:hypothetical protein